MTDTDTTTSQEQYWHELGHRDGRDEVRGNRVANIVRIARQGGPSEEDRRLGLDIFRPTVAEHESAYWLGYYHGRTEAQQSQKE